MNEQDIIDYIDIFRKNYFFFFAYLYSLSYLNLKHPNEFKIIHRQRYNVNELKKLLSLVYNNPSHTLFQCSFTKSIFKYLLNVNNPNAFTYASLIDVSSDGYHPNTLLAEGDTFRDWFYRDLNNFSVFDISWGGRGFPDHTLLLLKMNDNYYILQSYYYSYTVSSHMGFYKLPSSSVESLVNYLEFYYDCVQESQAAIDAANKFMISLTQIDFNKHVQEHDLGRGPKRFSMHKYILRNDFPEYPVKYSLREICGEIRTFKDMIINTEFAIDYKLILKIYKQAYVNGRIDTGVDYESHISKLFDTNDDGTPRRLTVWAQRTSFVNIFKLLTQLYSDGAFNCEKIEQSFSSMAID